jgi:hypothetical protein
MMRKRLCITVAAALAVGGIVFSANVFAQDAGRDQPGGTTQPGDATRDGGGGAIAGQPQQERAGAGMGEQRGQQEKQTQQTQQAQEISSVIARVADAALSEGGMTRINAYIVEDDRDRLTSLDQPNPQLRQNVERLRQVWRDKYNADFNIGAQALALNEQNSRIITGDPTDAARQAGERVGPGATDGDTDASGGTGATGGTRGATGGGGISDSSGGTAGTGAGSTGAGGAPAGQQQVMLLIPETMASPADARATDAPTPDATTVIVRLVRPAGADTTWNIDVPDTVDARRFQDNLQRQIGQLAQQPEKLPASEPQAYVVVAREVLVALTDAETAGEQGQRPGTPRDPDRPGRQRQPGQQPGQQQPGEQQPGQPGQPGGGMPR